MASRAPTPRGGGDPLRGARRDRGGAPEASGRPLRIGAARVGGLARRRAPRRQPPRGLGRARSPPGGRLAAPPDLAGSPRDGRVARPRDSRIARARRRAAGRAMRKARVTALSLEPQWLGERRAAAALRADPSPGLLGRRRAPRRARSRGVRVARRHERGHADQARPRARALRAARERLGSPARRVARAPGERPGGARHLQCEAGGPPGPRDLTQVVLRSPPLCAPGPRPHHSVTCGRLARSRPGACE